MQNKDVALRTIGDYADWINGCVACIGNYKYDDDYINGYLSDIMYFTNRITECIYGEQVSTQFKEGIINRRLNEIEESKEIAENYIQKAKRLKEQNN